MDDIEMITYMKIGLMDGKKVDRTNHRYNGRLDL